MAIVSLLVAMLLPALSSARESARAVQCLANQRHFLPALLAYVEDYHGYLPIGTRAPDATKMSPLHSGAIAHYTGTVYYTEWSHNNARWPAECKYISAANAKRNNRPPYILKCPTEDYTNHWGTDIAVSYGWNSGLWGLGASDYFTADSRRRIRLMEIVNPGSTTTTGEWLEENGHTEYDYYDQFTWRTSLGRPKLSTYHKGGGTVLWSDGHVTRETWDSMSPDDFDRRK